MRPAESGGTAAEASSSCSGSEAHAWVRGAADATAAGPFPAFAFYSQTAHLCLFDVTQRIKSEREADIEPGQIGSASFSVIHM